MVPPVTGLLPRDTLVGWLLEPGVGVAHCAAAYSQDTYWHLATERRLHRWLRDP
jgi:hypothetical protein